MDTDNPSVPKPTANLNQKWSIMLYEKFNLSPNHFKLLFTIQNPLDPSQNIILFQNPKENALYVNFISYGKFLYQNMEILHENLESQFEPEILAASVDETNLYFLAKTTGGNDKKIGLYRLNLLFCINANINSNTGNMLKNTTRTTNTTGITNNLTENYSEMHGCNFICNVDDQYFRKNEQEIGLICQRQTIEKCELYLLLSKNFVKISVQSQVLDNKNENRLIFKAKISPIVYPKWISDNDNCLKTFNEKGNLNLLYIWNPNCCKFQIHKLHNNCNKFTLEKQSNMMSQFTGLVKIQVLKNNCLLALRQKEGGKSHEYLVFNRAIGRKPLILPFDQENWVYPYLTGFNALNFITFDSKNGQIKIVKISEQENPIELNILEKGNFQVVPQKSNQLIISNDIILLKKTNNTDSEVQGSYEIFYTPNALTQFQKNLDNNRFQAAEEILNSNDEREFEDETMCVDYTLCYNNLYKNWLNKILCQFNSDYEEGLSWANSITNEESANKLYQIIVYIANRLEFAYLEKLAEDKENTRIDNEIKLYIFWMYLKNRSFQEAAQITENSSDFGLHPNDSHLSAGSLNNHNPNRSASPNSDRLEKEEYLRFAKKAGNFLNSLRTFMEIYEVYDYDEFEEFQSENILSTFIDACNRPDLNLTITLWKRHNRELLNYIDAKNIVDILNAMSKNLVSGNNNSIDRKLDFEEFVFGYSDQLLDLQEFQDSTKSKLLSVNIEKSFILQLISQKRGMAIAFCKWLMGYLNSNKSSNFSLEESLNLINKLKYAILQLSQTSCSSQSQNYLIVAEISSKEITRFFSIQAKFYKLKVILDQIAGGGPNSAPLGGFNTNNNIVFTKNETKQLILADDNGETKILLNKVLLNTPMNKFDNVLQEKLIPVIQNYYPNSNFDELLMNFIKDCLDNNSNHSKTNSTKNHQMNNDQKTTLNELEQDQKMRICVRATKNIIRLVIKLDAVCNISAFFKPEIWSKELVTLVASFVDVQKSSSALEQNGQNFMPNDEQIDDLRNLYLQHKRINFLKEFNLELEDIENTECLETLLSNPDIPRELLVNLGFAETGVFQFDDYCESFGKEENTKNNKVSDFSKSPFEKNTNEIYTFKSNDAEFLHHSLANFMHSDSISKKIIKLESLQIQENLIPYISSANLTKMVDSTDNSLNLNFPNWEHREILDRPTLFYSDPFTRKKIITNYLENLLINQNFEDLDALEAVTFGDILDCLRLMVETGEEIRDLEFYGSITYLFHQIIIIKSDNVSEYDANNLLLDPLNDSTENFEKKTGILHSNYGSALQSFASEIIRQVSSIYKFLQDLLINLFSLSDFSENNGQGQKLIKFWLNSLLPLLFTIVPVKNRDALYFLQESLGFFTHSQSSSETSDSTFSGTYPSKFINKSIFKCDLKNKSEVRICKNLIVEILEAGILTKFGKEYNHISNCDSITNKIEYFTIQKLAQKMNMSKPSSIGFLKIFNLIILQSNAINIDSMDHKKYSNWTQINLPDNLYDIFDYVNLQDPLDSAVKLTLALGESTKLELIQFLFNKKRKEIQHTFGICDENIYKYDLHLIQVFRDVCQARVKCSSEGEKLVGELTSMLQKFEINAKWNLYALYSNFTFDNKETAEQVKERIFAVKDVDLALDLFKKYCRRYCQFDFSSKQMNEAYSKIIIEYLYFLINNQYGNKFEECVVKVINEIKDVAVVAVGLGGL